MPRSGMLVLLGAYLHYGFGSCTEISLIDSMPLKVCPNRRIRQHKTFAGWAPRDKHAVGWFFGFKLPLVVNDCGELLAYCVTAGNRDDRQRVSKLVKHLFGKLFGDQGYLSQRLCEQLWEPGVHLITKLKTNRKNRLMDMTDKLLQRQRSIAMVFFSSIQCTCLLGFPPLNRGKFTLNCQSLGAAL